MKSQGTCVIRLGRVKGVFLWLLALSPVAAYGQIDLFGNIAAKLDQSYKNLHPPFDSTRVYDIGWNVTPAPVLFQYSPFGNPADVLIPIPGTLKTVTNGTNSDGNFPYESTCAFSIKHNWLMTDGMTGNLVGNFNAFPGIDSGSPGSGGVTLVQGESATESASFSIPLTASVTVPANTSVTFQTFVHEHPVTTPFEVDVKIGGSFRFEAIRNGGGILPRQTTASFTSGLGAFYKLVPDPHIQAIDDQFTIVKLHGTYTGAVGDEPGSFRCEARAVPQS